MAAAGQLLRVALIAAFGLLAVPVPLIASEPKEEAGAGNPATPAAVSVPKPPELDAETKCLALAVYWEGRAESREGQVAIAHTVLNRVGHGEFPDTICGVVAQKSASGKSCQFSWWCDGKQDVPDEKEQWDKSVEAARAAKNKTSADPTKGALFFHSVRVDPNWDGKRERIGRIGDHIFYR